MLEPRQYRHGLPCPGPDPWIEPAGFSVPEGACDCHAHVIDDGSRFPLSTERSYTPPPASERDYLAMLDATGMTYGVLVQVSVHGLDNRFMLEVLARHPERLRGVAVIDDSFSPSTLAAMHELGVRGTRVNVLFGGGVALDQLETLATLIAPYGWHLQLLVGAEQLPSLLPRLVRLQTPLVIDHMGHPAAAAGVESEGFRALCRLIGDHGHWVKLSAPYRLEPEHDDYAASRTMARRLAAIAPERVLYGSDWPHVAIPYQRPNTGHMRNLVGEWFDDAQIQRLLVSNPATLYGFGSDAG